MILTLLDEHDDSDDTVVLAGEVEQPTCLSPAFPHHPCVLVAAAGKTSDASSLE